MSKIFTRPFRPLDWAATPHDFAGDYQLGPYQVEEAQRYVWGTRYLMWDGRVFKYSYSISALKSYHLSGTVEDAPIGYITSLATAIGERSINVTIGSRVEDDLAGGYMFIFDETIDNSVGRGIVGNDATSGETTMVHLDYPLAVAVTISDHNTLFENPYRAIQSSAAYVTFMGVAASPVSGAGYDFWLQTYGIYHSSGGETLNKGTDDDKDLVVGQNGGLFLISTHDHYQRIGYMITGAGTHTEGPLMMLQLSV